MNLTSPGMRDGTILWLIPAQTKAFNFWLILTRYAVSHSVKNLRPPGMRIHMNLTSLGMCKGEVSSWIIHTGAYQEILNSYEKVNSLESAMNLTFLSMGLVCRNAFIVRPCSEIVGVKGWGWAYPLMASVEWYAIIKEKRTLFVTLSLVILVFTWENLGKLVTSPTYSTSCIKPCMRRSWG